MTTATTIANPKLAFIIYWGNCESRLQGSESFSFITFRHLADFGAANLVNADGEIIDYELNSPLVYLRFLVQGLSTPGNGEGGSEQIREGAQNKNMPVRRVLFWNDRRPH